MIRSEQDATGNCVSTVLLCSIFSPTATARLARKLLPVGLTSSLLQAPLPFFLFKKKSSLPIFISGKLRRAWLYFISSALIFFKFWRFHSHSFDHVHHSSHDSQGLGLTFLQPLCVVSMITRGNQTSRTIIQLVGAFFFLISPYAEDCRQRRTHREPFVFAFLCILMAAAGPLTASCLQYSPRAVSRHQASIPDSIKSFPIMNITYMGRPWFLLYFLDRDGS